MHDLYLLTPKALHIHVYGSRRLHCPEGAVAEGHYDYYYLGDVGITTTMSQFVQSYEATNLLLR